ncbi:N(4)-(Beta-N-acetylglucosaminyl)-L-asparaginase isoform X1 [Hydra vulgaris]|uniref:N(4)-(Beta-N-acetylglucosaminyl)-L-asparaginase isoform X1 n=1 Tax=Hydra vulgaris TaxID=6087 RepID=UPI001F5E7F50|nr:N(4)-(Beta-N-acetylglucosaminyl)-L-asparaginase isoform X1 [Hydra vulgaris]
MFKKELQLIILLYYFSMVSMSKPIVINTWPWKNPTLGAWEVLKSNGSLLDAVVKGCTIAEEDRSITTVGWGGSPAENGETALDALLMDGPTHNVGAVGSLKRVKNAIAVARHVLENTQHTFLVGEDATRFAIDMGFKEEDLRSEESILQWKEWKNNKCQPNFWKNVWPNSTESCGPYKPLINQLYSNHEINEAGKLDINNHDTIGMIAINKDGDIVAGTSSNGATFKITGRVGDSPITGSGAYVDNDIGAAVATGDGDIMMRFLPSYQAVENMRHGMSPTEAAVDALRRIVKYYKKFEGALVVVNKQGDYGASCYGWNFQYSVVNEKLMVPTIVDVFPFA